MAHVLSGTPIPAALINDAVRLQKEREFDVALDSKLQQILTAEINARFSGLSHAPGEIKAPSPLLQTQEAGAAWLNDTLRQFGMQFQQSAQTAGNPGCMTSSGCSMPSSSSQQSTMSGQGMMAGQGMMPGQSSQMSMQIPGQSQSYQPSSMNMPSQSQSSQPMAMQGMPKGSI